MRTMTARPTAASQAAATPADAASDAPPTPATPPSADVPETEAPRGRYHHGDLANALTRAGVDLAREGGPGAVVLREAARRVRVSPAAAYRHFAGHDDLLYTVKLQAQAELAGAMLAGVSASPPAADPAAEAIRRMAAIGLAYLRFALAEPGLFRTAFCHAEPSDEATPDAPDHAEPHTVDYLRRYRAFQILSETLDQLAELGILPAERRPNAEVPAWACVHGLAMLLLDGPLGVDDPAQREALLHHTINTIINGLIH
jgi:AcrR family transcriptional regulator